MFQYPKLTPSSIANKSVLIRLDLDVPLKNGQVADPTRLEAALPSLRLCLQHAQKTLIIGHLGRPKTIDPRASLKPVYHELIRLINQDILFINDLDGVGKWGSSPLPIALLENLRFWPQEAANDLDFAHKLAQNQDLFINDSFACSHREVSSVVGLPRCLPTIIGLKFAQELQTFKPIINKPKKPITIILGGAKPDKLKFVENFVNHYDSLLIGGALVRFAPRHPKIITASLTPDGLDITTDSAQHFSRLLSQSATTIWNGPMGKVEDPLHFHGTEIIAQAIVSSPALKIAGGADTEAVISRLNLNHRFDHLSTGGGAMLHLLAHRSLPALESIR